LPPSHSEMLVVGLGSLALRVSPPVMRLGVAPQHASASMPGCGGAAPFAPFAGSGSVGDQSQYAPGGQWTQYADGVVVPAGAARMPLTNEAPSNVDGTNAPVTDQAPQVSPALARGQDMHGCGGAAPFASFAGGGSGIGASAKWAPGGQWTTRTTGRVVPSAVQRMKATATDFVEDEEGTAAANSSPALAVGQDMHGCGGAAPFASFAGGGSGSDQTKWAPGGQWTYLNRN